MCDIGLIILSRKREVVRQALTCFSQKRGFLRGRTRPQVSRTKSRSCSSRKHFSKCYSCLNSILTGFEKKGLLMLVGYARVSTQDRNLELQREALTKAGCQKVFEDQISGTRVERPGLAKAQEILREGDTLVVLELDRLGRSVKQLVNLVGKLSHAKSGCGVHFSTQV